MEADEKNALNECNETELISLAFKQGLGRLRLGLPRHVLIALVEGSLEVTRAHLSDTIESRKLLESFLARHWEKVRSQLPGCNGKCNTFNCSDGRHAMCFEPNKSQVLI